MPVTRVSTSHPAPAELMAMLVPPQDFDARPVVEDLVRRAREARASDLHLRPVEERVEVLLRRDGVLQRTFDLPREVYERLLVGLKNMARLASYKHSVPQDGRLSVGGAEVRVAVTPTHFGEKVVLRLVASDTHLLDISDLGFTDSERTQLQRMVEQPQGLLLATGPAGSGKTTTLFAALRWLFRRHPARLGPTPGATLNIVTLEDPIECVIPEFTQTAIQPAAGLTFAAGLRSLLRQDPEVILVGEIRDGETAAAAVQASLTGHLVLSTLHTRDSVGVVPRLLEMGIEPYLVSASLAGVIYQRLVRRLCDSCRRPIEPSAALVADRTRWGLVPKAEAFEAVGCEACAHTGYHGRTALAELLEVTEEVRQGILDHCPLTELRARAQRAGLVSLRTAALERVAAGLTSYEEVCRSCPE